MEVTSRSGANEGSWDDSTRLDLCLHCSRDMMPLSGGCDRDRGSMGGMMTVNLREHTSAPTERGDYALSCLFECKQCVRVHLARPRCRWEALLSRHDRTG